MAKSLSHVRTNVRVDWLSYTYLGLAWVSLSDAPHAAGNIHPRLLAADDSVWEHRRGMLHYTMGAQSENGSVVLWSPKRLEMGTHVTQSGQVFDRLEALAVIENALNKGAHFVRCDVAIDVAFRLNLRALKRAFVEGEAITTVKKARLWEDTPGETLYIGSKESDAFLRIYDKAAEQNVPGTWYRIELQLKHDLAHLTAIRLHRAGYAEIPCIVIEFCDWPHNRLWVKATRANCSKSEHASDRKLTNTRAWLCGQVARCLAKEVKVSPEFLSVFLNQVAKLTTF
jgi:hypothetical protein